MEEKLYAIRCETVLKPTGHFLYAQKVPKDAAETGWFLEIAEVPPAQRQSCISCPL